MPDQNGGSDPIERGVYTFDMQNGTVTPDAAAAEMEDGVREQYQQDVAAGKLATEPEPEPAEFVLPTTVTELPQASTEPTPDIDKAA